MQSIDLSRKNLGGSDSIFLRHTIHGREEQTRIQMGLLREYFLKQKDIADYTDEYIWHLSLTK